MNLKILLLLLGLLPIASFAKVTEGQKFPPLNLPMFENPSHNFSDSKLKGKVVIVDFWASWCEPCKIELPALSKLAAKYKGKGLEVMGVNVDENIADAKVFIKEHPVKIPLLYDGKSKALISKIGTDVMPSSFILDRSGNVKFVHKGYRDGDLEKFEKEITTLLKSK